MKRFMSVLTVLAIAGVASAAAPVAVLVDDQPGFNMTFDDGTSAINQWGQKQNWSDSHWDFSGGNAEAVTDGSWSRLRTTMKNDNENVAGMSTAMDWVFSFIWTNNVSTDTTVFASFAESGGDMVRLTGANEDHADPGVFNIDGGDGSGSYVTQATVEVPIGQTSKVTLAYEAADGLLDFYLDDTLVVANFQSREGNYDIYRFQILGGSHSPAGEVFDELIIGVPEPATMALLGVGALALLRRRR